MSLRTATATVYLGDALTSRLDDHIAKEIEALGLGSGELAAAMRRREVPTRSSVIQAALDAYLTKQERRR